MFQLFSSFLDWLASPQGANHVRACFCLATVLGMDGRLVAVGLGVFSLWLAFQ